MHANRSRNNSTGRRVVRPSSQRILADAGVEFIQGRGRVVDAHTVEVAGRRYTAKNILLATGGRSIIPDLPGKELAIARRAMSSDYPRINVH